MKKHIASILFLFLLSTFQLIAQSHSVKRLGIEQGLSNNYVVSITQDKQGFLWFATEEGNTYLDAVMTREAEYLKAETAEIYVDHTILSEKMYHQIQKNISRKQIKRICFRVAAILIPVIFLIGLYLQINSRVDLFGTTEYEEIRVAKGERIQMMFQDGTRVYINSDSWLKYPKKFGLSKREIFLVGEAYFVVAKNKKRPFIVI